jgi:hypothetical protein
MQRNASPALREASEEEQLILATLPATRRHIRLALAIVAGNAVLPVLLTIMIVNDLITSALLLSQFFVVGRTEVFVLAVSYLFMGLMTVPLLLTFMGHEQTHALQHFSKKFMVARRIFWIVRHKQKDRLSRRSLRNPIRCVDQATAITAAPFRFLRQRNRPSAPRPVAKSGRAAGSGVTAAPLVVMLLKSAQYWLGVKPFPFAIAPAMLESKVPLNAIAMSASDGSVSPKPAYNALFKVVCSSQ